MFAGIDTHKDSLAVAVIDDAGQLLAAREVPNTEQVSSSSLACSTPTRWCGRASKGQAVSAAPSPFTSSCAGSLLGRLPWSRCPR